MFLKKLKIELSNDPAIPLLVIYWKEPKTLIQKNTHTHIFIAALFPITKLWKHPKRPSVNEWIKKWWHIYTMEYYSAIKKNEILAFMTAWVNLEGIMLSEISQFEKDKYHIISLICGI